MRYIFCVFVIFLIGCGTNPVNLSSAPVESGFSLDSDYLYYIHGTSADKPCKGQLMYIIRKGSYKSFRQDGQGTYYHGLGNAIISQPHGFGCVNSAGMKAWEIPGGVYIPHDISKPARVYTQGIVYSAGMEHLSGENNSKSNLDVVAKRDVARHAYNSDMYGVLGASIGHGIISSTVDASKNRLIFQAKESSPKLRQVLKIK